MRSRSTWRAIAAFLTLSSILSSIHASTEGDQRIQATVHKALGAYSLTSLLSSVEDGAVTLSGQVPLCRDRLLAIEIVKRIPGITAIRDRIEVSGPLVPDSDLKAKIEEIITDQIRKLGGFGVGSLTAQVHDGVVTLSGTAAAQLATPAIEQIAKIMGVKNLNDHILRVQRYETEWPSPVTIRVQ